MPRLLIVDDDSDQLLMRRLILEGAGHAVSAAENAQDARRLFTEIRPEVVVMDLRLPSAEDGLELIREFRAAAPAVRIIVLTGMVPDESHSAGLELADEVLAKPCRAATLLRSIAKTVVLLICLIALSRGAYAAGKFAFRVAKPSEVVAEIEMRSPGSAWSAPGREAAVAEIAVDGARKQHVMLHGGAEWRRYPVFFGRLAAGEHTLSVGRDPQSAPQSGLEIRGFQAREIAGDDPQLPLIANAPVLFARADTVGKFSDIPLLVYCERLREDGRPLLQYTVIFSNEDGGTSTRALMARWGRTSDIEYVYRAFLDHDGAVRRATIQAKNHQEVEFRGARDGSHPLLMPVTRNNMLAAAAPGEASPLRYQIAPIEIDLSRHSREEAMDANPDTYRVMAHELERENKLRPFGMVDGEKISDPRNYLYVEPKFVNRDSALAVTVRLKGEARWRSSDLGRLDYAIERDGWVRSAVELPPGTEASGIQEIGFQCKVRPPKTNGTPAPVAGVCLIEEVNKAFLLDGEYRPGPGFWSLPAAQGPWEVPSGQTITFRVHDAGPPTQ